MKSIISFSKQSGLLEGTINEKFIADNYSHGYSFEGINLNKFKTLFKKMNIVSHIFAIDVNTYYDKMFFEKEGVFLDCFCSKNENRIDVTVFGKSLTETEKFYKIIFDKVLKPELTKEDIQIVYSELSMATTGMRVAKKIFKEKDFKKIDDNYYPDLDVDLFTERFLSEQENILILNGPSGIGKTKFCTLLLKKCLLNKELIIQNRDFSKANENEMDDEEYFSQDNTFNIKVCYTKNKNLLQLDEFWDHIKVNNYDLVILDDIYLSSREERQEDSFISQLLSYSDGLFPSSTKFVITSNNEDYQIDDAILRAGRLFDSLELRPLKKEEALLIWLSNNLSEDSFNSEFKNEKEILQSNLGSIIKKMIIGNKEIKSYFKDKERELSKKGKSGKKVVGFNVNH